MNFILFFTADKRKRETSSSPPVTSGPKEGSRFSTSILEPLATSLEESDPSTSGQVGRSENRPSGGDQEVSPLENDIGKWVGRGSLMTVEEKKRILQQCWKPPPNYNFEEDAKALKRKFLYAWLDKYSPWLVYSSHLKGAFCLYCVIFAPPTSTVRGVLGSFVVRPFTKYKRMHEFCKSHVGSSWHLTAMKAMHSFMVEVPIDIQMVSAHKKIMLENRKYISSLVSVVIFCGVHDLPLRGKQLHEGILEDLIQLKIDSGDCDLERFTKEGKKNARYLSPTIQNELICLCGNVVSCIIVEDIKKACAFSILADETADISGKEQLSIGLRFFDEEKMLVREDFLGFVELEAMDATTIATAIDNFLVKSGLEPEKCVGQGYDGCSAMAGKDGGVQKFIRDKYKNALYFHCASHRLNLVVNDLNSVVEIRNTISTIKEIVNFFRQSVLRRKHIPNIPGFCETRWSEKYRCISVFMKHFVEIVQALEKLTTEGNSSTRNNAFLLFSAVTRPIFIICAFIISKYSALLQPVVNILQGKQLNLLQCYNHIETVLSTVRNHRESADSVMGDIYASAKKISDELGVELLTPRVVGRQHHRSNIPSDSPEEYWKRSVLIPYLDSFSSALTDRFSHNNEPAFSLLSLHPHVMLASKLDHLKLQAEKIAKFYDFDEDLLYAELQLWHNKWAKKMDKNDKGEDWNETEKLSTLQNVEMIDLIKEADPFYPSIKKALMIAVTLPCTTCSVERTFSTLRRVKTWTRSTMGEDRLNGLCMLSLHRDLVKSKKATIVEEVVDQFASNPRRLMLS